MLSLEQLKQKHGEEWARQPPWVAAATAAAKDAAESSAKHAADIDALRATLDGTAQQLDDCRRLLVDAARERDEAIARASQLEAQNASLQAAVCEAQRKSAAAAAALAAATAQTESGDAGQTSASHGDDGNNNDGETVPAERRRSKSASAQQQQLRRDQDDSGSSQQQQQQHQHPEVERIVAALRAQNDVLLAEVGRLAAALKNAEEQQQQSNRQASSTSSSSGLSALVERFALPLSVDSTDDGAGAAAQTIQELRGKLAAAEERCLVLERLSVRAAPAAGKDSAAAAAATASSRAGSQCNAGDNNGVAAVGGGGCDGDDSETAPSRRPRSSAEQMGSNGGGAAAAAATMCAEALDRERQHFAATTQQGSGSGGRPALPPSTTEMLRFWAFGQAEMAQLRSKLDAATARADAAALRAQAADSLARDRSELVGNLQTLASELEASRDESARLRCDIVGLERESSELAAHLSAALASQMSAEEVARCAKHLKDGAAKAAEIAALTAPEANVAKDAIKRNQALLHELTVMTKRRDELREEIAAKQRTLEHLSSNIWLRTIIGGGGDATATAATNTMLQRAELGAIAGQEAVMIQQQVSADGSSGAPAAASAAAAVPASSSTTAVYRQKLLEMQAALAERDATILALRRTLAAAATSASPNTQVDREDSNGSGAAASSSPSTWNDALLAAGVQQDAVIAALHRRLALTLQQVEHHEAVNAQTLRALAHVTGLASELMALVDGIVASHPLFAARQQDAEEQRRSEIDAAVAAAREEERSKSSSSNGGARQRDDDDDDGSQQQQQQQQQALPPGTLSAEETALVRSVLDTLKQHASLAAGRSQVLDAFKHVAALAQQTHACTALGGKAAELGRARAQIAALLAQLEELQKGVGEQAAWNKAVEAAVRDMKAQLAERERAAVDSMALFADMSLHKIDIAAKEQIAAFKPQPAAATGATAAAAVAAPSASADSAKTALKNAEAALLQLDGAAAAAAATATKTE